MNKIYGVSVLVLLGALTVVSQDKLKTAPIAVRLFEADLNSTHPGDCFKLSAAYTLEKIACPVLKINKVEGYECPIEGNIKDCAAKTTPVCENSYTDTPMPCNACGTYDGKWINCSDPPAPFDVPAKQVETWLPRVPQFPIIDRGLSCPGPGEDGAMCIDGQTYFHRVKWACEDTTRFLLQSEDQKWHCLRFGGN